MEKDGKIVLTQDDMDQYNQGEVSSRVKETWNITFSELKAAIESGSVTILSELVAS